MRNVSYNEARWSSIRQSIQREHFAPVEEITLELAQELISIANNMWELLLVEMSFIASHPRYQGVFKPLFNNSESGATPISSTRMSIHDNIDYSFRSNKSPTMPSGYKIEPTDVPGSAVHRVEPDEDKKHDRP